MTGGRYDDLPPAARRRRRLRAFARPAFTTTGLLLLYYLMPLGDGGEGPTALALFVALVFFAALLTWQIRQIATAEHPRLRAIEALSLSVPLFILSFAALYFMTARGTPASFSEGLSRTDALYFAVTVFASVGFGDIAPLTQGARVMVMIQMVGDLILVGVVARVMVGAVQAGLRRHDPGSQPG
ncbi:MAG TPA: potassium channel family protein [Dermatophilaceae bacterium]|jgi:Ion channel